MPNRLLGSFCFFLFFWTLASAHAAQLKDVRVGVHRGFSRVVFQLDAVAEIEGPIIQGSGKCTFKLKNTESPFTSDIPGNAKAKVEGIELIQDGEDLIAFLRFAFDSFEVSSFSLPDPPRIVLDVYRLRMPLKKADKTDTASGAPLVSALHKSRLSKKPIDARPGRIDTAGSVDGDTFPGTENERLLPTDSSGQQEGPESRSRNQDTGIQRSPTPEAAPREKPAVTVIPAPSDSLRNYLLAVLGLSVAILVLLCILLFKKPAGAGPGTPPVPNDDDRYERTMSVIDERINTTLDELSQNFRIQSR